MGSSAAQFVIARRMGMCESDHQVGMWSSYKPNSNQDDILASKKMGLDASLRKRLEDTTHDVKGHSNKYSRPPDKVLRRLAQNREAARKCRLKKKAYVQQLESSRMKLAELEHELQTVRQQGLLAGGTLGYTNSSSRNPGIAKFEEEYGKWVANQQHQTSELREALQQQASEIELRLLVEGAMNHYKKLFDLKATAAKCDVFYIISGMWKTAAERCFLWIGGFRPTELLKVLSRYLDPTEKQDAISTLRLSCQQAEDALFQGLDKLQQTLSETLAFGTLDSSNVENYVRQMKTAIEKLEAVISFVNQADHLRSQTLHQMHRILNTHQAARALLALGDHCECLRNLSSLWAVRQREPT